MNLLLRNFGDKEEEGIKSTKSNVINQFTGKWLAQRVPQLPYRARLEGLKTQ